MSDVPLTLFVLASLVLIITPGQDLLLIMSRSVAHGAKAGIATATGVSTGLLGHTVFAALGLGAILQASEFLFSVMKIAGAVYLVYLGIRTFRAPPVDLEATHQRREGWFRYLFQGALSNLANPKIVIFYFAFLPQFLPPTSTAPTATLFLLGIMFALLTFLVTGPFACAAGALSGWLRARPDVQTWLNRACGGVLVGLGVRLAWASHAGK